MSVTGGINIGLVVGIAVAVVGVGVISIVAGVLFYRRSVGKGFFSAERTNRPAKATPAAPNLAQMGISSAALEEGDGGGGGAEGPGKNLGPQAAGFPFAGEDDDDDDDYEEEDGSASVPSAARKPGPAPIQLQTLVPNSTLLANAGAGESSLTTSELKAKHPAQSRPYSKAEEAASSSGSSGTPGPSYQPAPDYATIMDRKMQTQTGAAAIAAASSSSAPSSEATAIDAATALAYGIDTSLPPAIQMKLYKERLRDGPPPADQRSPVAAAEAPAITVLEPSSSPMASSTLSPSESGLPASDSFVCVRVYSAKLNDELDLAVGDRVTIHESFPDGWAKGQNERTGKSGMFPLSAVVAAALGDGSLKILQS
ncbi:hypothetical protein DFJ73DRAFT_494173 [Zopfochytrium polystomum]|nr:hypothetical protein DFJ73DRAFT_494173 [Zopfochytrium polystomum]